MEGKGFAELYDKWRVRTGPRTVLAVMDMRLGISYIGARSRTG